MRRWVLSVVACVSLAPLASASAPGLVAPRNGATLHGGSFTALDWRIAALPHAEEWEAFLSVDGGKYYAFRITPHLDIDRRQTTWFVPNVAASDARILIRVGDERVETEFELPVSFSIVSDGRMELPRPSLAPEGEGESAREGEPAVIGWAYGDRSGSRVTQQVRHAGEGASVSSITSAIALPFPAIAPNTNNDCVAVAGESSEKPRSHVEHRASLRPPRTVDVLLASRRLNI